MSEAEDIMVMVEGAAAANNLLLQRSIEPPKELTRLLDFIQSDLEWSGTREGPGFGPMDSGPGQLHDACPVCGGLKEASPGFIEEAVGHRSGCRLAAALGAPTVPPEDGQEVLAV